MAGLVFQSHPLFDRDLIHMSLDEKAYGDNLPDRINVENYCRSYLASKQRSIDESLLQNMVDTIAGELFLHITKETVNKEFVNYFTSRTGNKCKDGQIEVVCTIDVK